MVVFVALNCSMSWGGSKDFVLGFSSRLESHRHFCDKFLTLGAGSLSVQNQTSNAPNLGRRMPGVWCLKDVCPQGAMSEFLFQKFPVGVGYFQKSEFNAWLHF